MSNSKYIFKHIDNDFHYPNAEYPPHLGVTVEFDGEVSLCQLLEGFKLFLRGAGFSDEQVEGISYD